MDRKAYLKLIGGDISAEKFIELVIMGSGQQHVANIQTALGAGN